MPIDDDATIPDPERQPSYAHGNRNDETIGTPAPDKPSRSEHQAMPLPQIPGYSVTRLIGEGGMGAVYEAQQNRPARRVALKIIRPGAVTPRSIRRFEHEQEVLARLQHPGIAAIHEAGLQNGTPFFAMEFIDGLSLTQYAEQYELGTRDRLALFTQVCDAVHHAHAKGVIHRDLKPANILVSRIGDPPKAQAKVLDFGIARVTESDIQATTMHTDIGQVVGTLPYMSPEQVAGENDDIDTRSDVYALGVVLYELLAGQLPYDLKHRLLHEAARVIRENEPTKLSGLDTRLRGDVETIVGKAMEKQRDRRYQSASDLGADVRRYLGDEPIEARPPSRAYQVRKFAKRNRALVSGVMATFVVLLAGIVASSIFAVRAETARVAAVESQHAAEQARKAEADQRVLAVASAAAEREQRELAQANAQAERERAEELGLVLGFQEEQLGTIDTVGMGSQMRAALLTEARATATRLGEDPEAMEAALAQFEATLARMDFTGLAMQTLEINVFDPAIDTVHARFNDRPQIKAWLLESIASICSQLGLIDHAYAAQAEALMIHRELLGNDNVGTLRSAYLLSVVLMDRGDDTAALRLVNDSFNGRLMQLGPTHLDTLSSQNMIGVLLNRMNRHAEAEPHLRHVLEQYEQILGPDDVDTLTIKTNLAVCHMVGEEYDSAEALYLSILDSLRRIGRQSGPHFAKTQSLLGVAYQAMGRYDDAEPLFRNVYHYYRRELGSDHPDTLVALSNLGVSCAYTGRQHEGLRYLTESYESAWLILGPDHPHTMTDRMKLVGLMTQVGRFEEAELRLREAVDALIQRKGQDYPQTITAQYQLADFLRGNREYEACLPILRANVAAGLRLWGKDHAHVIAANNSLASCLAHLGQLEEAESLGRDTLERSERFNGPDHIETRNAQMTLALIHRSAGEYENAEAHCRAAIASALRVLSEDDPELHEYMRELAIMLEMAGRAVEAEQLHRDLYAIQSRTLGLDNYETLLSLSYVGTLLAGRDEYEQALEIFVDILPIYRERHGDRHRNTLTMMFNVGYALSQLGRIAEADPYYTEALIGFVSVGGASGDMAMRIRIELVLIRLRMGEFEESRDLAVTHYECCRLSYGDQDYKTLGTARILGMIYDAWDEHQPDAGHAERAEQWRAVWRGTSPAS